LGQKSEALDAALRARDLDPGNPATHRTLAGVLLDADREQDAVVALVAGVLITQNGALRQDLLRLYRAGLDPGNCAMNPDGTLNFSCGTVHRNVCAAAPEVVRLRPDVALPACP
jgi:hypothetical protein